MKWILLLLWDPLRAFDLNDRMGQPDHGKIMGFLSFLIFVGLIMANKVPPLGIALTMFSAVFGTRVFIALIKSRAIAATETRTIQEIVDRRDPSRGMEAT